MALVSFLHVCSLEIILIVEHSPMLGLSRVICLFTEKRARARIGPRVMLHALICFFRRIPVAYSVSAPKRENDTSASLKRVKIRSYCRNLISLGSVESVPDLMIVILYRRKCPRMPFWTASLALFQLKN